MIVGRTAKRKAMRVQARIRLIDDYRDDARALISNMRQHNQRASNEDRFDERAFRTALRRLRHEFTAGIKHRSVVSGRS